MKKWVVIIVLVVLAIIGYNYIYQDHREISSEKPFATITSMSLLEEFQNNSISSESKYLNQTVEVSGTVTESSNRAITLDSKIYCSLNDESNNDIIDGQELVIKGRLIGYDDLLEEIKLDQCHIINLK